VPTRQLFRDHTHTANQTTHSAADGFIVIDNGNMRFGFAHSSPTLFRRTIHHRGAEFAEIGEFFNQQLFTLRPPSPASQES
jgi:hypothetical protein